MINKKYKSIVILIMILTLNMLISSAFAVEIPLINSDSGNTLGVNTQGVSIDYNELHAHDGNDIDDYSYKLSVEPDSTGYGYTYADVESEFQKHFSFNNYISENNFETYTFDNVTEQLLQNKNLSILIYIKTEQVFIQDEVARVNNQEDLDPSDNDRFGAYFSVENKKGTREYSDTFVTGTTDWTLARLNINPLDYFYPYNDGTDKGKLQLNLTLRLGNSGNLTIGSAWYDSALVQLTENEPIVSDFTEYGFYKEAAELYLQDNYTDTIYLNYNIDPQYEFNTTEYLIFFTENNNLNEFYLDIEDNPDTNNVMVRYKSGLQPTNAISSVNLNIVKIATQEVVFTDIVLINIYDNQPQLSVSPMEVHLDMNAEEAEYQTQQLLVNPATEFVKFTSLDPSIAVVGNWGDTNLGFGQIQAVSSGQTSIVVELNGMKEEVTVYVDQAHVAINSSEKHDIQEAYNEFLADIVDESSDKVLAVGDTLDSSDDSEISVLAANSNLATDKKVAYKVINFIRVVSGLNPIKPNVTYEAYADAGLKFLARQNMKISHTAARGSTNNLANIGLSNSNLTSRTGGANVIYDPNEMIYAFLIDIGDNNLYKAGHRRWLLNDVCDEMGFAEQQSADTKTSYGAVYVLDDNGKEANVTTFPSAGDFPIEMITDFYNGNFTWSIMLGDKYKLDSSKQLNVSIRRKSDGKVVNYRKVSENQVNANTDWFSVVSEIVGNGQGININPASFINGNSNNLLGETFEVSVGGPGINGVSSTLKYSVHFYSMKSNNTKQVNATNVSIDPSSITINRGENTKLVAKLTPSNATNKVTWTSRNPSVVSVNENGVVTGLNAGTAQVLAQTDNKLAAMATIKVENSGSSSNNKVYVTQIDPGIKKFTLAIGQTYQFKPTVTPANATDKTLVYTVASSKVASISKTGLIKGLKTGTTTVTISSKDGGAIATVEVAVSSKVNASENTLAPGEDNDNNENTSGDTNTSINPNPTTNTNNDNVNYTNDTHTQQEYTTTEMTSTNNTTNNVVTNRTSVTTENPKTGIKQDLFPNLTILFALILIYYSFEKAKKMKNKSEK